MQVFTTALKAGIQRTKAFENRAAMSATTESAVDVDAGRFYFQRRNRLLQQHRLMRQNNAHSARSSRPGGKD